MTRRIEINEKYIKEAHIAPFTILRVACLPADVLLAFVKPELSSKLGSFVKLRDQLRETGRDLIELLERLVPQANTNDLRKRLIQLKRNIHNNRSFILEDGLEDWLEAKGARSYLGRWRGLQAQSNDFFNLLVQETEQAGDVIDTVLEQCWSNPTLQQGISVASPSLASRISPGWRSFKTKKRKGISRSLFAYVTRAAGKTSPFSTLTSNCVLPLDTLNGRSRLMAGNVDIFAKSSLNRSIPAALRNALLLRHARQLPIFYHLSPHIRISGDRVICLSHWYRQGHGILWLDQKSIILTLAPGTAEILQQMPDSFCLAKLEEALQGLGIKATEATATVNELLRRDIIRSELEWGSDCDSPATFLADKLSHCSDGMVGDFRNALVHMDKIAKSFSMIPALNRAEVIGRVNAIYTELHKSLNQESAPEIRSPINENAWIRGIDFHAGDGFTKLFERLGKVIHDQIGVSASYLWLRDRFIETYGEGGACDNVPQFIITAWGKIHELFSRQNGGPAAKRSANESDRFGGIAIEHVTVPITFFAQFISESLDALESYDVKIVLNHVYNRIGWQTVRWCDTRDESCSSLQNQTKIWLRERSTPRIPVSITVSSESSVLQAHLRCTDRALVVDVAPAAQDFKLGDLVLKHNPKSGLLELMTRDNVPIQTNYMGALLPMTTWGPRYLAILLGEPFEIIQPPLHQFVNDGNPPTVSHQPRVEQCGCVIFRETWRIKSTEFLHRLDQKSVVDCLIAAQDFRDEHKISRFVFAQGLITSWVMANQPKGMKPTWLDFQNVACLEEILVLAKNFDWITLSEALPGPGKNVLRMQGREYVSEFIFEAVFSGARKDQN